MFNRKRNPSIRSLIGEGTTVEGNVAFTDGLRVDGQVKGNIVAEDGSKSVVVISEQGKVHGEVHAGHVIVNGEVRGNVVAAELLELQPKARIHGDVGYKALEMHQGAQVQGKLSPLANAGPDTQPILKLASNV
ncbi:MAG: polymer-forming cytoskeletal protein [Betaproteobacteria bacterium]|nr:polymer-forming cytoskeletal protein [Betaproteobacteria bacterium]